jgi:MtN3 and saliva related transmembrane protein
MNDFFGYISAFCTTAAFVPQAIKVYRTKQADDISLSMILLMTVGVGFWVIYGFLINALPVITANVITFVLALYILIMKIKLDKQSHF